MLCVAAIAMVRIPNGALALRRHDRSFLTDDFPLRAGERLSIPTPLEIFGKYPIACQKFVEIGAIALGETR